MSSTALPTPLVSVEWLVQHLGDPGIRVIDASVAVEFTDGVRSWVSGLPGFESAHIPGAQRADLLGDFSGAGPDFVLPTAAEFAEAAGRLGVGPATRVVVYDDSSTTWATRVWWLFRHYGHAAVTVLDGGLAAWRAAGAELASGAAEPVEPVAFESWERGGDTISTDDLVERQGAPGTLIVSALPAKDYSGERSMRARAGHIPGSLSIPAASLVDPDTGTLLPREQLALRLAPLIEFEGETVVHCGSGVSATLPLLALELLGHDGVVLYEESLNVWAADPARPLTAR